MDEMIIYKAVLNGGLRAPGRVRADADSRTEPRVKTLVRRAMAPVVLPVWSQTEQLARRVHRQEAIWME